MFIINVLRLIILPSSTDKKGPHEGISMGHSWKASVIAFATQKIMAFFNK
jgi:hypothetical protein